MEEMIKRNEKLVKDLMHENQKLKKDIEERKLMIVCKEAIEGREGSGQEKGRRKEREEKERRERKERTERTERKEQETQCLSPRELINARLKEERVELTEILEEQRQELDSLQRQVDIEKKRKRSARERLRDKNSPHIQLMVELEDEGVIESPEVVAVMSSLDFKHFLKITINEETGEEEGRPANVYQKSWAEFVSRSIEKWARYLTPGANVLNVNGLDFYQTCACSLFKDCKQVVSITDDSDHEAQIHRIARKAKRREVREKVVIVYEPDFEDQRKGHEEGSPYDLLFIPFYNELNDTLIGQVRCGSGLVYCVWESTVYRKEGEKGLTLLFPSQEELPE